MIDAGQILVGGVAIIIIYFLLGLPGVGAIILIGITVWLMYKYLSYKGLNRPFHRL